MEEWEWRDTGVELALARVIPSGVDAPLGGDAPPFEDTDPGRIVPADDLPPAPTALVAFELPWDGGGTGDSGAPFAAVSSAESHWSGAALFADPGDGSLEPLGGSGRTRSIVGTMENTLPPASPHIVDRTSRIAVRLIDPAMDLSDATGRQLALGTNRALVGREIVQFAAATPLGGGRFELAKLLRGRGGTEAAIGGHAAGEDFALLDLRLVALDPSLVGSAPGTQIVASGRGDPEPVGAPLALQGITVRPLSPVHGETELLADGTLHLCWTRRARGAWFWLDGVDTPLHEQSEAYQITYGPLAAPVALWSTSTPELVLSPAILADLSGSLPGGEFHVRQQGSYALSEPLLLAALT